MMKKLRIQQCEEERDSVRERSSERLQQQ